MLSTSPLRNADALSVAQCITSLAQRFGGKRADLYPEWTHRELDGRLLVHGREGERLGPWQLRTGSFADFLGAVLGVLIATFAGTNRSGTAYFYVAENGAGCYVTTIDLANAYHAFERDLLVYPALDAIYAHFLTPTERPSARPLNNCIEISFANEDVIPREIFAAKRMLAALRSAVS